MGFGIKGFRVGEKVYNLPSNRQSSTNRITVLVGPNGVGKSNLLAELVYHFTDKRNTDKALSKHISIETNHKQSEFPKKVIAQTFSPFSRFPLERSEAMRLREYLIDIDEQYSAIGITKGMRLLGSVSRHSVSRIIRKLYTSPEHAAPLSQAMSALGFIPKLTLGFELANPFRRLGLSSRDEVRNSIINYVNNLIEKNKQRKLSYYEKKTFREFADESEEGVSRKIEESIYILQEMKSKTDKSPIYEYSFDINLDSDEHPLRLLEAVLTLNRLGLLRISSCLLRSDDTQGEWISSNTLFPKIIDISDASSGQQQLLGSLFGVVAEAENKSLILIDEPELSLHPAWQTQFLDFLIDVLSGVNDCHVFVATHSALVAQRAQQLNLDIVSIGSEPLDLSSKKRKAVSVDQMLLETFGIPVRDSSYVSKLLISLVMDAEESDKHKRDAENKLNKILNLYSDSIIEDKRMNKLIRSAISLVKDIKK